MEAKDWEYNGYTSDCEYCTWCKPDGPCTYECIIPDPADEYRRQRKMGMDDWHPRRKRDDVDDEW